MTADVVNYPQRPIRVGISSCLLGATVRFDGGHKRDAFLTETLGQFVEWVAVCPEAECGLGTPREPMHLLRAGGSLRLVTASSGKDLTRQLDRFSVTRVAQLVGERLSGYVLKNHSPSCGMERVKVYTAKGAATKTGRGVFAARLIEQMPQLPIEEEGRLSDPLLRENFVERIFAYWRLRNLFDARWSVGDLVRFHTAHKLVLMAHSPAAYQQLGRLVAQARRAPLDVIERRYTAAFMSALAVVATRRRHTNVLQHMAGYLKGRLDRSSKAELHSAIEDYQRGLTPLIVPITLVRHHVRTQDVAYLAGQHYLEPHPKELMLRNHV
jgi:uncharacterized protein YbgA (DUF1722 family)/uncharacterized protein YbbK (DUF523 family)